VLKEHVASIIKVKEQFKQEKKCETALHGLFFDPEDRGSLFF
jgi:hypothetical protein